MRDYLYGELSSMEMDESYDFNWTYDLNCSFKDFCKRRESREFASEFFEIYKKLMIGARVALGLSPKMPELNGPWTPGPMCDMTTDPDDPLKSDRKLCEEWLKLKLRAARTIYGMEPMGFEHIAGPLLKSARIRVIEEKISNRNPNENDYVKLIFEYGGTPINKETLTADFLDNLVLDSWDKTK